MTAHGHFQGDRARTPEEEKFLEELARGIAGWPLTNPTLDSFGVFAGIKPLVVIFGRPWYRGSGRVHTSGCVLARRTERPHLGG